VAGWIAKGWHPLHRSNTASVECLPDRLIQRPECGFVKLHGPDGAVDVVALQPLYNAPQDDVRRDVVDRVEEGLADGRREIRNKLVQPLAR